MTWQKIGQEFWDECALADLSNGAVRTHAEALGFLYKVESNDLLIPAHLVRRFAGSPTWEADIQELLESGFWRLKDNGYVVEHHANVVRQSIAAQVKHREKERDRQQQKRRNAKGSGDGAVDTDVGTNVTTNVAATQPVSQTDSDEVSAHAHASEDDGWPLPDDRCSEFLGVDAWCSALVAGTVEGRPFCATHIADKKAPT